MRLTWALFISLFFLSLNTAAASERLNITGSCQSALMKHALEETLSGGDVHIGSLAEFEKTMREGHVDQVHIDNIKGILDETKAGDLAIPPLRDAIQIIESAGFSDSTWVCVLQANCHFAYSSNTAAMFLNFNHHAIRSNVRFGDHSDGVSPEWMALELTAHQSALEFQSERHPKPILVAPFRELAPQNDDPLAGLQTFEGQYLHELVHAADSVLIDLWLKANAKLIRNGRAGDPLFNKFVKASPFSTGRYFVSDEFEKLFLESRAYFVTYMVRTLFTPELNEAGREQGLRIAMFTAWAVALDESISPPSKTGFDLMKEVGLPGHDQFLETFTNSEKLDAVSKKVLELAVGPKSWGSQMIRTIRAATEI